tara:strand:+ start:804 stop:1574 length:771 start_codon:yes stop_codon:yes gene_type:complete
MKRSELRNIIRESVKELLNEQSNPTQLAGGNCDGATVHTLSIYDPNYAQNFIDTYGPNADMSNYVSHGPPGLLGPSYPSNTCMHSNGYVYEYKTFSLYAPNNPVQGPFFNSFNDLINEINTRSWASMLYSTSMTFNDVVYQVQNDTSGGFLTVGTSPRRICTGCTNTIGNQNPPEIYKCVKDPKFGGKCTKYTNQPPTNPVNGPFYSKQECIESGCEGIGTDIGPSITPFTIDPQSKTIDPEIDRMQDLANIKRER